jgi:hypothetical protein
MLDINHQMDKTNKSFLALRNGSWR